MYKALLYLIMPNAGQVKHGRGHAFDVLEELTGVYYEDGPSGGASDQAAHLLARMTLKEPLVNHGWYAQKSLYTLPLTSSPPNGRIAGQVDPGDGRIPAPRRGRRSPVAD